jgi:tetratricopeptide (TPR) repeat protein
MLPETKKIQLISNLKASIHFLYVGSLTVVLSACSTLDTQPQPGAGPETAVVEAPLKSMVEPSVKDEGLTADLLYDLLVSNFAYQEGELELASESVIRAARATGDPALIESAVRMAVHNKNFSEAAELGQRWIESAPQNYQASIITALAAAMNQQAEIALEILSGMMAQAEGKIGLRFGQLGEMFLQFAEGQAAQNVLLQLANEYPDSTEAWLVLAGMAQKNQDLSAMNSALDSLLKLNSGNERAAGYKLFALTGDQDAQAAFATIFLKEYPKASDFRLQYARLLLRLNDEPAALDQLLVLLRHEPKNSEALNLVALLYQAREDYENTARYFAQRIKVLPDDDRSRLYLANALQQSERYDDAKIILSEVSDPGQLFAAKRQMSLLIEQADGTEAALLYLQTLSVESEDQATQLIIDRELMLQRAGRTDEAYALIDDTLLQNPDNDTLRYHRALILVERDDLQGHEVDMRILLSNTPENAHYNNTLGYSLLVMSDRLDEASVLINKAHELEAQDPYILDSKGWLEYKLGNLDAALRYLIKAYSLDQDAEIAAHIGEVYWVQGDQEKAQEFWRQGDTIDATNKSLQDTKARFLNQPN